MTTPFIGDKTNDGDVREIKITTGAAFVLSNILDWQADKAVNAEYAKMLHNWAVELRKVV